MAFIKRVITLLSFALTLALPAASRSETFVNPYRIPTGSDPVSVNVTDVNGDGLPDILYGDATTTPATVHILLAQPSGGYLPATPLTLPAYISPYCRTLDANHDSIADLVCAHVNVSSANTGSSQASIATFLGNGNGTFGAPIYSVLQSSGPNYFDPSIDPPMDINSDPFPDLIVRDANNEKSYVLLGDGTGGFTQVSSFYDVGIPIAADVNGDGKPDLLFPSGPSVAIGDGTGHFSQPVSYGMYSSPGTYYSSCTFADMDGDGHLDAACTLPENQNYSSTELAILHGNPDGTFNTTPITTVLYAPNNIFLRGPGTLRSPLSVVDVNGDGILDILANAGDGFTVILGKPGLTFAYPVHYAAGYISDDAEFTGLESFADQIVDLNNDGVLDVVSSGPNGIYITYGRPDGTFNTAPAIEATSVIGYSTMADFNEDGTPDIVATGDQNIEYLAGKGDGTFASPVPLARGAADFSTPLSTTNALLWHGDFNGDGHQDILAIGSSAIYQYDLYLLYGHGDGTFDPPVLVPSSTYGLPLFAANVIYDINRDRRDDLITADTGHIYSALSQGNGTFNTVTTQIPVELGLSGQPAAQSQPQLADFDHDGNLDAALGDINNAYVLKGHGDGTFNTTGQVLPIPTVPGLINGGTQSVTTGDFDGDGNMDFAVLVVYYQSQTGFVSLYDSVLYAYFGRGDGTFSAAVPVANFNRIYTDLAAADLNKDGLTDFVLKTSGSLGFGYAVATVNSLPGRTFGPETNYYAGTGLSSLSIADINRDGFPDLLFANGDFNIAANSITILLNLGNSAVTGLLTSSPQPSTPTQTVTITATLTPPAPGPLTGSVTFAMDGIPAGSAPLSANSASVQVSRPLAVGTHQMTAVWPGDSTYPALTLSGTHVVIAFPTTITLISSNNPANSGTPVTFTATVASTGGAPAGSITFADGANTLGTVALLNGTASYTTSSLAVGSHPITATYAANGNFAGSSASLTELINGTPSATTLSASPNPAYVLQSVTLSATVSGSNGSPAGTVTFTDGSVAIGTANVNANGIAILAISFSTAGIHTLAAVYSGDAVFNGSTSATFAENVLINPTATTVSAAPNPGFAFQPITLTAAVSTSTASFAPGGSVTFLIGGAPIGSATVHNGVATLSTSTLSAGTYTVTAAYGGNGSFGVSTSGPYSLLINPASSTITISSNLNPASIGSSVNFTSTVSVLAGVATGTVTFFDGTAALGSPVTLSAQQQATLTTNSLALGTHPITAVYAGTPNFSASTSPLLQEVIVVYVGDFSVTASPATASLYTGDTASFHVTVTPTGGFNQPLALSCAGLPADATCSFSATSLPTGMGAVSLVIHTAAPQAASNSQRPGFPRSTLPAAGVAAGLLLAWPLRRKRAAWIALLCCFTVVAISGCGSSPIVPGTPPGTYTVSVVAQTSLPGQNLSHSTSIALKVNSLF